jgi:hypothetical protein
MKKNKLPKYQVGTKDKGLAALKAASMAVSGATLSGTPAMASMSAANAIDTNIDENVQELSPGLCVNSMGQRVDCVTKELINATDTNPLMQGFTMDSDGVYRKKVITDKPGSPLGYSEEFKGINAILDATQAIAGNINDFKTSKKERQDYIEAIQPDARYNQYEKGLNNVPVYMRKGGQTQDDREMLSGVADMLRRVKSSSNRKEIAKYMMDGFREEGVVFKPSDFLKSANAYSGEKDLLEMKKGGIPKMQVAGSQARLVNQVPEGYQPLAGKPGFFHSPYKQFEQNNTSTGVAKKQGPKMSNEDWLKFLAQKKAKMTDDTVFLQKPVIAPTPAVRPIKATGEETMWRGSRIMGSIFDVPRETADASLAGIQDYRDLRYFQDRNEFNKPIGEPFLIKRSEVFGTDKNVIPGTGQQKLDSSRAAFRSPVMAKGGEMIRRADGSYSERGLWDNIRANKGSGKKPTKAMLEQERKLKAKMRTGGGMVNCANCGHSWEYDDGGENPMSCHKCGGKVKYEKGGIYIDPSKKGTFTAAATKNNMSVQEFANKVLSAPEGKYSPIMRKKANFAKNAAGWKKQEGGLINETGYLPGTPTENNPYNIIPSNVIDMEGVPMDIMAYPNNGTPMLMPANSGKYNFPESDYVLEVPAMDEESSYQEDMSEMKTGGIPDRYKNKGFNKVGVKRKSTRPGKKWMVLAKKGDKYKIVHGGDSSMQDFSQHRSKKRQKNFWNRMGTTNDPFSARYWHKRFGTWQEGGQVTMGQQQPSQEEVMQILQIFAENNNMTIEELMAKLQQLPEDQMQQVIQNIVENVQENMMEDDDEKENEVEEMQTGGLKNFEERMYNSKASLKNSDGTSSTHKMISFEADGKYYAAPTIVEIAGELVPLDDNTAIDYALKNNEYKQFATEKEAFNYANNGYKKRIKMQFEEGGYAEDMPNAELEQGEVFQTQQGGITKVPESEPRHEDGGSPQANVSRVLEDTSDKRKDIDSRLLLINPDQAFRLTGFKPKKSVSHSKLYEQANESYAKKLNTFEKKIKDNMDFIRYKNGGIFAENALNENIKMLEAMPKPIDIFDTIYAHQEEVKQRYNITNGTNQAKTGGRKLPMYQTGTNPKKGETRFDPNDQYSQQAWDGTKWVKTSEYGKSAPSAQTGTIDYIKGKAKKVDKQPTGSKQVAEDAQNIYYGIPGIDINSGSAVPKTSYGKKTTKTDEEYIKSLANYNWDDLVKNKLVADTPANKTIYDKYSSEYAYSYIPKQKGMTVKAPPVVVDEPNKGGTPTTTPRKYDFSGKPTPSKFNEPLRWYDTMPSTLNYLSSLGRTPVDLEQLQYEPINTREESWLPQIMQTEGDFQTALRSIPMDGGTGQANIANLLAQKYSADQQAIAGVESRNKAKNDQTNAINAQGRMQMNATNLNLRDTFNNRILQGKEVQRVSKLNAFDDYATMVAQNAKLNREGNLLMQLTPYFDQFAEFNGNNYTPSQFAKDVNNGRYKVETVRSSNGQLQELIVDQTTGKSVPKSQVIK